MARAPSRVGGGEGEGAQRVSGGRCGMGARSEHAALGSFIHSRTTAMCAKGHKGAPPTAGWGSQLMSA